MTTILITGANRGIGLELVRQYLDRPDIRILATCRQPEQAAALQTLAQKQPDRVIIVPLDVSDPASVQTAAQLVAAQTDALDVLINNAGINRPGSEQTLTTMDADVMTHILRVNTVGPLLVVQAFVDLLADNAKILNVSSQMGAFTAGLPSGSYGYRASKAGLNMITRCMASDLGPRGITTITLHPGWVQTDMGGPNASITTQESAAGLIALADRITPKDNGDFFNWNGEHHVW